MVCDGPEPPDNSPHDLTPPPMHNLIGHGDESDEDAGDYVGYEPLPQGPEGFQVEHSNSDDEIDNGNQTPAPASDVPSIEPVDQVLCREIWNAPRPTDPIQMDNEKAQQVMSAMANFVLPHASIPEWAQSVSEDQWKETLNDRIEKLKQNQ